MKQTSFPWWFRIKGRVLVFGIAMSIFPLLFLGLATYNAARQHMQESIQQQNYVRATSLAEQTSTFVTNMADSLLQVTSTNVYTLVNKNQKEREIILGTLLREEPFLEELKVADTQFRVLGQAARREAILPKTPTPFETKGLLNEQPFAISEIFFSSDGRPQFYLTVGIKDPGTRETVGYLQAKTDLRGIVNKFANLRVGKGGYAYLVDERGNLIGHTDFSKVLSQENVHQKPTVVDFLTGVTPSSHGKEYTNLDGIEVLGLFASVGYPNWGVFIEQPVQEAYEPINDFALKLLGIVFVAISIVTLTSIIFALKLTRPIENLETEVRRIIQTGDLQPPISQQSKDEIGRLVESFNTLIKLLDEKNQTLKAEKQLLATVVEGIGAGMLLLDPGKRIIWWNSIFTHWIGDKNFKNLLCDEVIDGEGIECFSLEKGRVTTLELNGKRRYIRQTYYELNPSNQENAAYLLLLEDVTQEIEMEARVIETDKMAALGLMASGVAHEINNPLAIASAYSEDFLDRISESPSLITPDEIKKGLKIIMEQILRCKKITGRLLDFARKRKDRPDLFEISAASEQTLALLSYQAKQKKVEIKLHFELGLFVWGNENEWQQVVLNIIANALDASPHNSKIEVKAYRENENILFMVKDNGQGISPHNIKKVFEPFFTTKPAGKGTGLGLFVSYGIIEKMHGQLTIESTEGKGTVVIISLPSRKAVGK